MWGAPPKAIHAEYRTGDGHAKVSLLLVSGWWGLARHFHYLPELVAAAIWSMPAFHLAIMPFVYLAFLTVLLLDRAYRWVGAQAARGGCHPTCPVWDSRGARDSARTSAFEQGPTWEHACGHALCVSSACCIDPFECADAPTAVLPCSSAQRLPLQG